MIKINDYFCAPNQGRRLIEMGIGGDSIFEWEPFHMETMSQPTYLLVKRRSSPKQGTPILQNLPALMHQEIRNLCCDYSVPNWQDRCMDTTSEQLAKILIDHLEALP